MNKKEIVINTARELFTKYGYKKVSMDEIAQKAKVTKKTIYTYFKDKQELFSYFIFEELESIKKEFDESCDLSFIEKVSSSIYHILKLRKNSPFFANILNEKENTFFLKLYDDEMLKFIEEKIKEQINKKTIKNCDSHLTSFIIYKIYIAIMFEYSKELDEEKVTKEITSILKSGLLN